MWQILFNIIRDQFFFLEGMSGFGPLILLGGSLGILVFTFFSFPLALTTAPKASIFPKKG